MAQPKSRDMLIARGRDLQAAGAAAEAESFYRAILDDDPDDHEALHLLGVAAHQRGDHAGAVATIRGVLERRPDYVPAWQNLVLPLLELDRVEEAVACGRRAVDLAPDKIGARVNLARALIRAERLGEAETVIRAAMAIDPRDPIPLCQLGHIRLIGAAPEAAEQLFAQAIAVAPTHVEALYNRGVALQTMLRDDEAAESYRRALALDPDHRGARLNLGVALRAVGRVGEALAVWRGFTIDPESWPELAYDIACAHLLAGDWRAAWRGYEHRLTATRPFVRPPATTAPRWDGRPLPGETLMVHHEQGLGDTIQFVRFLTEIAGRVGRVVFVCQPALAALLADAAPFVTGAATLVVEGETIPDHAVWSPLLSLPGLVDLDRANVPSRVPYLAAQPERVAAWARHFASVEAGRPTPFRVGLVWQGNPKAPVEKGRSIPLAAFAPLAAVEGVAFHALQKGPGREQTPPPGMELGDLGPAFDEGGGAFLDTAAVIASLDLVITSDTSVAHVAGALGRPVWLIAKRVPEWRWGTTGGASPWYPTLRIFRQSVADDWSGPMAAAAADLAVLVGLRHGAGPGEGESANQLFEAGAQAHGAGRWAEAVAAFAKVARVAPRSAQVLNFLGMAMIEAGGNARAVLGAALPIVAHSVALSPDDPGLFANLAVLLKRRGDLDDARFALLHALRVDPAHKAAGANLINVETARGDGAAASARALEVARRHPTDAGVQATAAEALRAAGRNDEAIAAATRAVRLAPKDARHRVALGRMRSAAGDSDGAARAWEEALAIAPKDADALSNLGVHERSHGETGLSLWLARRAVEADPAHADAWSNLGIAAGERERPDEAREAFARAIALRPSHADARMAYGMSLLAEGRYAEGLPEYEWRLKSTRLGLDNRPARIPPWGGQDPRGRRFLIVAEQGFGDAVQFVRYAAVLKAAGAAAVWVGARSRLKRLLAGATGVDGVIGEGDSLPPVDFHAHLMSLPHLTGTRVETIPAPVPYIRPDPERTTAWAARLAARTGFRVGLVWQGNPDPQVDRGRSIALAALAPLAAIPGVRLIALQKGPGSEQITAVAERMTVESLGEDFDAGPDAFADTAAVIANLDLVIATDTAVPHLAGALGRPVWLLLKARPEWRWLDGRGDSPWYPTARLFRQSIADPPGEARWTPVVAHLAAELARLVAGDRSRLHDVTPPPARPSPKPRTIAARFAAALAAHRAGRHDEARRGYADLLAEDGAHGEALHMTGALALQEGRHARAAFFFACARAAGLSTGELATNTAVALRHLGRLGEAEVMLRRVLAETPTTEAALALGNVLRDQDRAEAAVEAMKTAVRLAPKSVKALRGLGNALRDDQEVTLALKVFDRAVKLDGADAELRLDRAHALLQAGRLKEGFAEYAWRWKSAELRPHPYTAPQWDGTRLRGRTLFVHGEQGLGDQIQFLRFVIGAAQRGGRVVVGLRRQLIALARTLPVPAGCVIEFAAEGGAVPAHDLQIPLLGLPEVLGTDLADLPGKVPYLAADPARVAAWRARFADDRRLKVGLIWQGNPSAKADRGRSPPLAALAPLAALDGVRLIVLQKEHGLDQLAGVGFADRLERPAADFDAGPDAFLDTAAAMKALDLVVASDTAAAHLAGALGRPALLMLKRSADWRWLKGREDSPWYPSLTLVRQSRPGDWGAVAARVAEVVAEEVAARDGRRR
ncbi:tetratricopeptide repeat protein [Siculibacillus lacustris]|uniref:Tetratricopeptide repeat protein n=1 Tax=Siculibacillus lacustris TaxID=1549641 RepID=A0A4Q9VFA5_9HYPH|nr:tetratricopeptide repeat protein [Siculibacillus lacustris]TBW33559.1 tetratricopeptide repeat protein [Siculibacillus lacustris]